MLTSGKNCYRKPVHSEMNFQTILMIWCAGLTCAGAMKVNLAVNYNTIPVTSVKNSTVMLTCQWQAGPGEVATAFDLYSGDGRTQNLFFRHSIVRDVEYGRKFESDRMTALMNFEKPTFSSLVIRKLSCKDKQEVTCRIAYQKDHSRHKRTASHKANVDVKLSTPVITLTPSHKIVERTSVKVKCEADVGSYARGSLVFQIYNGWKWTTVSPEDARLTFTERTRKPNGCTVGLKSALNLTLTREEAGSYVTCTVVNPDLTPEQNALSACVKNVLCTKGEPFVVLFPVSNSTISVERVGPKLLCHAIGVPEPVIVWQRGELTLYGHKRAPGLSELDLMRIRPAQRRGVYFCKASNTLKDKTFTAISRLGRVSPADTEAASSREEDKDPSGHVQYVAYLVAAAVLLMNLAVFVIVSTVMFLFDTSSSQEEDETTSADLNKEETPSVASQN